MKRLHHQVWPEGVPKDLPPNPHTLDDNLRNTVGRLGDKTAMVFYGALTTYNELNALVDRIAGYLQAVCNLQIGDRVGVYMQNSPQFVASFYGVIRAGGIVVPINPMNRSEETASLVQDAGIRTLIAAQENCEMLRPLGEAGELDHVVVATYADHLPDPLPEHLPEVLSAARKTVPEGFTHWREMIAADHAPEPIVLVPEDPCLMPYTSGSTGRGKGCLHNHLTTQHAAACMYDWFGVGEDDIFLSAAPMFHVVGMQAGMNVPIAVGGTMVILPRWNRDVAAHMIREQGVTAWCTVPTMVIDFLNRPDLQNHDLATLRVLWGGGIAMPEAVAKKLHDLTGLTFLEGYGMSETIAPATANPVHRPKAQCGGVPCIGTDVVIADPDTHQPLAVGEVGEILISGPQVMLGYWRNPEADAESFVEIEGRRFLRSGDLGRMDEEGYIFIVDRLKRMINASGYKVWPTEVEAHLYHHPAIAEACVIGATDPYRGETVKAVAVLKPGATLEARDLTEWAHTQMAAYKVPRILEVVEELPKSGSGKVLWRELQARENAKGDPS